MPLQDVACCHCGNEIADVLLLGGENCTMLHCPTCNRRRSHAVIPLGGTRSRWRYADTIPLHDRRWEDHVRRDAHQAEAVYDIDSPDEKPCTQRDGAAIAVSRDKSAERRERLHHERRQRLGQNPVFIHAKR